MGVLPLEFWLRLAACELNRILALKSGVRWWRWPGRRQRLVPAVERELELSYPPLDDLATPDPRRSFDSVPCSSIHCAVEQVYEVPKSLPALVVIDLYPATTVEAASLP